MAQRRFVVTIEDRHVYLVAAKSPADAERAVLEADPATLERFGGPGDGEVTFIQVVEA